MQDGVVAFEAEHPHSTDGRGAVETWSMLSVSGISGDACMEIAPDNDSEWAADPETTAPRLNYGVYFEDTGVFYIYIRGDAGDGVVGYSDSCFAGLDGKVTGVYDFTNEGNVWGWKGQIVTVNTPGFHVINLFAREDAFRADKVVITKSTTAPTGNGPTENAVRSVLITADTYL
jgi:Gylcosyl hydrolase family 115 C-terminal domain